MARPLTPDQLIAAFRKWGVPFREYPGWRTRGRPQTWGPVHGVITHHTGSDSQSDGYLEFLFEEGRASEGIPAPLCQFATEMDGTVWLGAAGRANQAGRGSAATLDKVIGEDYPGYRSEIKPGPDSIDGNARYYGNEVMFDGGQPMTPKQYRSAVLVAVAIIDAHGWSALAAIGHREHSSRKWDPGQTDMAKFRRDVRDTLAAGPAGKPTPTPEPEDQPMSTQEKNEILQAIEGLADQARDINVTTVEQAKRIREGMVALIAGLDNVDEVALAAEVSRLMVPAVVAAVAEKATLSEDDVEQAIRDVLGSLANQPTV